MSLRVKILLYLAAIHVVLAAVAFIVLRQSPLWLLVVEALFALSILLGALLVRSFFVPLDLIRTGSELVAEQDFTSTFRPVGQPEMDALIAVYNRMIEELRRERLRVEEQHQFLDKVLTASPAGVLTLDFEGRVSSANPSAGRLLGVGESEILGRAVGELASPLASDLAALEVGSSRVLPVGGRRLKCSRSELYDRGFPRSFFLIEELTEELRASERAAYEKLIRTLSHEVNNSVGPVRSLLESFAEYGAELPAGDREDFAEALAVASSRLENLRSFMSGYAEVVRLPPPERRPCDVATLVDEILVLLRGELARRRIAWVWERRDAVPPVALDRNQIEQVLVNVLKNGLEAIGEDGRLTLSLACESEGEGPAGSPSEGGRSRPAGAVLTVSDTGPGVPEEVRARLFTPFFSTKRNGRGLGLTLAHEILSQHGFEFALDNRPEGGAAFTIRFPVLRREGGF